MSTTKVKSQKCTFLVSCTLHHGKTDEYLAVMQRVIEYLSKEEPDFLHIEMMRAEDSPNKITYLEHWAKPVDAVLKTLSSHQQLGEYLKAIEPLLAEKRHVEFLQSFGGLWARTRDGNFSKM
ncbi:hypothetical protein MCOR25_008142 [Pyricularia grisea]|nr:hypothetical protein MCOR25_008142 [Pyricularia grisea]